MVTQSVGAPAWLPAFRAEYPFLEDFVYFQTGSEAPLARSVQAALVRAMEEEGGSALAGTPAFEALHARVEAVRGRLGRFLGLGAENVGWTENTSLAIRVALDSIVWQPGDALVTTSNEHISTRYLCAGLAERRGVTSVVVPGHEGDEALLAGLERALDRTPRARLVLISHVSCQDGRRLPVAEATRLAHAHGRGVPVLVDGAQAAGQFPVDVAKIGCDFYAGSTHKWLLGPGGLGYLVVADSRLGEFLPALMLTPSDLPRTAARRMEMGTTNLALRAGAGAALDLIEGVGTAAIEEHVARLSARVRAGIQAIPGLTLLTPLGAGRSSGITSFAVPGNTPEAVRHVVQGLWERARVVAKYQVEHPAVRVSVAAFNSTADVDRLLEPLPELVADLRP